MTTKFYDPNDPLPSVLTVLGAVVLAGTLGYIAFVPVPTTSGIRGRSEVKQREIRYKIDQARAREGEIETALKKRKSTLPPDEIGSEALARITRLAQAGGLKLVGFRPQRTFASTTGVTIYPYTLSVEGSFPATATFIRAVETTTTDIAVTSYSATASDGESAATAATIAVALFADTPKAPAPGATPAAPAGAGTAPRSTTPTGTTTGTTAGGTTNG